MSRKHGTSGSSTTKPLMKRVLTWFSAVTGAVAMSLTGAVGVAVAEPSRTASGTKIVAGAGEGRYKESIDWLQWATQPDQTIETGTTKTVWSTPHDAGNDQWIATQCSVTAKPGSPLETYRTGEFYGDAFSTMYDIGANNIVGVANRDDAGTAIFDYSCKEYVISSQGAPTLEGETVPQSAQEQPLEGLVFADAESNNWLWYQTESIGVSPLPEGTAAGKTPTWRLLDSYRTDGCDTSSLANIDASTGAMTFRSNGGQCANDGYGNKGPASAMFLENSQSAEVSVKGGGRTAVALGVMPAIDFGDAPQSYGTASSQFGPDWEGGQLGADITPSTDAKDEGWYNLSKAREDGVEPGTNVANESGLLAGMTEPTPRLGDREDSETANGASQWADGDDKSGAAQPAPGDEDGVAVSEDTDGHNLVEVAPNMTNHTFSQQVKCAGTGNVRGWIDWNRSGAFDGADDASDTVACPAGGNVTLRWTVPDDVKRSVAGDDGGQPTFERVRMVPSSNSAPEPTGFTPAGEVEDYQAAVRIPVISVMANLPSNDFASTGGRKEPSDQFELSLKDGQGNSLATARTEGESGGAQTIPSTALISDSPVQAGADYTIGAKLTPGSASQDSDYNTAVQCRDISRPNSPAVPVDSATGAVTMPGDDANVQCIISKAPTDESTHARLTLSTVFQNDYSAALPDPTSVNRTVTPNGGAANDMSNGIMELMGAGSYAIAGGAQVGYSQPVIACSVDGGAMTPLQGELAMEDGQEYNCTLTYTGNPGSVAWTKQDSADGRLLAGSIWMLTDPQRTTQQINDCVAASANDCAGADKNPAAGQFQLTNLAWGAYKLAEKSAPEGYNADTEPATFEIKDTALDAPALVFTDTREVGSLKFDVNVKGTAAKTAFLPSATDPDGNPIAYTQLNEAQSVPAGYTSVAPGTMASGYQLSATDPVVCTSDQRSQGWVLDMTGANANKVNVRDGENVTCTVPYEAIAPQLTVRTVVNNTHGGTATADDFTRTVTDSDGTSVQYGDGQTSNVSEGKSYKVTGSTKAGYSTPVTTYTDGAGNALSADQAQAAMAAGTHVIATLTYNDQPAQVTVTTLVPQDGALNAAALERTVTNPDGSTTAYTNGETRSDLNAGTYMADGQEVPGYTKSVSYRLDGVDVPASAIGARGVAVGVGQHLEAFVTYVKTDDPTPQPPAVQTGHLKVVTVVQGGDADPNALARTVTGPNGYIHTFTNGERQEVPAGTYQVTGAPAPAGYADPTYQYALADGTVLTVDEAGLAIQSGQDVTATITYAQQTRLSVNVSGHYQFGGTDAGAGSRVSVATGGSAVSVPINSPHSTVVSSGVYSVSQLLNAGYRQDSITITDRTTGYPIALGADGTFEVPAGHDVQVDIANVDEPASLTVTTVVEPGGSATADDIARKVTYPDGSQYRFANGQQESELVAGRYVVSGADVEGYTKQAVYLLDGNPITPTEAGVAVANGQSLAVTFTYTPDSAPLPQPRPAGITVHRNRDYRFGGSPAADGSQITRDGKAVTLDKPEPLAPGVYSADDLLKGLVQTLNIGYDQHVAVTVMRGGKPVEPSADGTFDVQSGDKVLVDFENTDKPGTLEWSRFDKDGTTLLAGSTWVLGAPDGRTVEVGDCTTQVCAGLDQDPKPGVFKVTGLTWGDWTVSEVKAPFGHMVTALQKFTLVPQVGLVEDGLLKMGVFQDGKDPVPAHVVPGSPTLGHVPASPITAAKRADQDPGKAVRSGSSLSDTGADIALVALLAAALAVAGCALAVAHRGKRFGTGN